MIKNYSNENLNVLYSWIPHDLKAEEIVFFPDACPGKSPLPTGTAIFTKQENWRKFAISDCGCGMLLCKSNITKKDFSTEKWNKVYFDLLSRKGKLGDLGSGNHFLDALESYTDDKIYFLIHTGSRDESKLVDDLVDKEILFNKKFLEVCEWAKNNRFTVMKLLERYFGKMEIIIDRNHNHFEYKDNGVIIRKGAVKIYPNELTVIPSSLNGDVVLVKATEKVNDTLNSLCHGTGRTMSRSDAKKQVEGFDFSALRNQIYIPEIISNESIKTDLPFCYRDLDECLNLIDDLITIENRFSIFAYLGQI